MKAKASDVASPSGRPAAARAPPRLLPWPPKRPSSRCVAVLASTAAPPAMIISALSTDKATTSRTLPVVAVSEPTAQQSHRALRRRKQYREVGHYGLPSSDHRALAPWPARRSAPGALRG